MSVSRGVHIYRFNRQIVPCGLGPFIAIRFKHVLPHLVYVFFHLFQLEIRIENRHHFDPGIRHKKQKGIK
jgi:hypothetical protein